MGILTSVKDWIILVLACIVVFMSLIIMAQNWRVTRLKRVINEIKNIDIDGDGIPDRRRIFPILRDEGLAEEFGLTGCCCNPCECDPCECCESTSTN